MRNWQKRNRGLPGPTLIQLSSTGLCSWGLKNGGYCLNERECPALQRHSHSLWGLMSKCTVLHLFKTFARFLVGTAGDRPTLSRHGSHWTLRSWRTSIWALQRDGRGYANPYCVLVWVIRISHPKQRAWHENQEVARTRQVSTEWKGNAVGICCTPHFCDDGVKNCYTNTTWQIDCQARRYWKSY